MNENAGPQTSPLLLQQKAKDRKQVFEVASGFHRLGEVRFFQKNDRDLRRLPSVPNKFQEKVVLTKQLQQVIQLLLRKTQMDSFGQTYQALFAGKVMTSSDHLN